MYKLNFRVKTLAPIIIADTLSEQNLVTTSTFIKGSNILGAFASKYIKKNKLNNAHTNETFQDWFLSKKLIFSNAVILSRNEYNETFNNYIIPNNLQYEKNNKNEITDIFVSEHSDDKITKIFNSYGRLSEYSQISQEIVKTSIQFHHTRERDTGTSKDGEIFNYESMDTGQTFGGELKGEKETLNKFMSEFKDVKTLYLGRSKNTQYGKVSFSFVDQEPVLMENNFENARNQFVLSLLSEAIILNDMGYSEVSKDVLEKYLNNNQNVKLKIEKAFIKAGVSENYLSVWKMKTPSEQCFLAGSSFKISITSGLEDFLKCISKGIGENTHQGFGQVNLTNLSNTEDKISLSEPKDLHYEKPEGEIPEVVSTIIKQRIKQRILEAVKSQAIEDVKTFTSITRNLDSNKRLKLSNSLVGRLESFIKELDDVGKFEINVRAIRKTSRDKLEALVFESKYFIDFLKDNPMTKVGKYLANVPEIDNLMNLIKIEIKNESNFELTVFKEYWQTFFSYLRKVMKTMGGRNEKQ